MDPPTEIPHRRHAWRSAQPTGPRGAEAEASGARRMWCGAPSAGPRGRRQGHPESGLADKEAPSQKPSHKPGRAQPVLRWVLRRDTPPRPQCHDAVGIRLRIPRICDGSATPAHWSPGCRPRGRRAAGSSRKRPTVRRKPHRFRTPVSDASRSACRGQVVRGPETGVMRDPWLDAVAVCDGGASLVRSGPCHSLPGISVTVMEWACHAGCFGRRRCRRPDEESDLCSFAAVSCLVFACRTGGCGTRAVDVGPRSMWRWSAWSAGPREVCGEHVLQGLGSGEVVALGAGDAEVLQGFGFGCGLDAFGDEGDVGVAAELN
jgi:hypothetical protein